ncbi:hypothetical protein AMECASPLE_004019 [Ameca splendens]|uniref:Uncharacterized protein n=1 Tax=Ameca splendens TaxID=208324 RepID=A0ABV0XBR6_9TELE
MAMYEPAYLPPNAEEQDFIQAYENVREKYKGTKTERRDPVSRPAEQESDQKEKRVQMQEFAQTEKHLCHLVKGRRPDY